MRDIADILGRFRTASPGRAALTAFAVLALLLESAVPAGFMPGSPGAGDRLIIVCPQGLNPAAFAAPGSGAHHHHHHGTESGDGDDAIPEATASVCPLGGAFDSAAALPALPALRLLSRGEPRRATPSTAPPRRAPRAFYSPRAPPGPLELTRYI